MGTALVTGGARGMGLEWCRQLAQRGHTVFLTARKAEKAQAAAERLQAQGLDVRPEVLDLDDESTMASLAQRLQGQLTAGLDLLVNNAGINPKDQGKEVFRSTFEIDVLDPDPILRCIRINGVMPIVLVKHLLPHLEAAQTPKVVHISSWLGSISAKKMPGHYGYATSKAALNMMNKALALQIAPRGVTSVVVNPGWVQTDMGGSKAELTPEASIGGMLDNVVARVGLEQTGGFFQWDGTEHAF